MSGVEAMFKYEIHLHSQRCSACGVSSNEEMIKAAKETGYTGVVFTNHFFRGNTGVDRKLPWKDFVKAYKKDFEEAKNLGEKYDIDVFFGVEEVYESGKECLLYGITPELLENNPDFIKMGIKEIYELVSKNGGFVAAAHPFRNRFYIPNPDKEPDIRYFDAFEVHNYFNTDEDNEKAQNFVNKNSLQAISGGDIHRALDFGKSGLAFYERLYTTENFIKALKEKRYKLIINGEINDI